MDQLKKKFKKFEGSRDKNVLQELQKNQTAQNCKRSKSQLWLCHKEENEEKKGGCGTTG